jgi:hypothetical protein
VCHDETGAPFVTWNLGDSLLESIRAIPACTAAFGLKRASNH